MKIKEGWLVNCALCLPFIGFAIGYFIEVYILGPGERDWTPTILFGFIQYACCLGIIIGVICLRRERHNNVKSVNPRRVIILNFVILFLYFMGFETYRLRSPHDLAHVERPPRSLPLPPTDDGRIPKKGDYMVIDLSGGTGASNYPITRLTAIPLGGWSDEYKTTKLMLRKIPKGSFSMGARPTEIPGRKETGLHTVTLTKDFYIGVFEVTQRQWELVMGNRPSWYTNEACYASRPVEKVSYYEIRETPLPADFDEAGSDDPLVDWPSNSKVNPTSFMGKLRAKTGLTTLDLPTEAQWEYACRAGTTTALNTGYNLKDWNLDTRMDVAGRYMFNRIEKHGVDDFVDTLGGTAKVGSYLPNDWGLYDMHGNVFEWCLDWFGRPLYPKEAVTDPPGAASGEQRVLRGGSYKRSAHVCRVSKRSAYFQECRDAECGLRVACTLP